MLCQYQSVMLRKPLNLVIGFKGCELKGFWDKARPSINKIKSTCLANGQLSMLFKANALVYI